MTLVSVISNEWTEKCMLTCLCCSFEPSEVGQRLPDIEVQEGDPSNTISMAQLFKGKTGVLFAVPGAFTPGCSKVLT